MKTATREKPILFSGPMVQAIQSGRKTQTRRLLKPQPLHAEWFEHQNGWIGRFRDDGGTADDPAYRMLRLPYAVGDVLYVRETWGIWDVDGRGEAYGIAYAADGEQGDVHWPTVPVEHHGWFGTSASRSYRPSIHMPKWAARLFLEVTDVRVERLQDITYADAIAEGVPTEPFEGTLNGQPATIYPTDPKYQFAVLWNRINGVEGPKSWNANPWVAAYTFRKVERP